jgi:hypothetical protein
MARVPDEVPVYTVSLTTTFFSQVELVALVRLRRPTFDFEIMNKHFSCSGGRDTLILEYGGVKGGELGFGSNYDFEEDMAKWEEQNGKFRLYIGNYHGFRGTQAPRDVQIRPAAYDSSMKLGWKYKDNAAEIDIFRVDGDNKLKAENVIYTLSRNDFDRNGKWWLDACNPIVIQKHETYVTICASAHLSRSWAGELGDKRRTLAQCKGYIMSADEVAWIENDASMVLRRFERKLRSAKPRGVGGGAVHAMLATLRHLAE